MARYVLDQPLRKTGLTQAQEHWVRTSAYPALLLTNSQYSLVGHPTHGHYEEYQDSGNPPANLEDWEINCDSVAEKNKPTCPYCDSDKVRSKGDKWVCENPTHPSGKPKSWNK